jgi:hypothetical protein
MRSIEEVFEATGKVTDEELLIGFEFYIGEGFFYLQGYYHAKSGSPNVGGYIPTLSGDFRQQRGPIQVKTLRVEITQNKFLDYFKRFHVVVVNKGFSDIVGREYEVIEEL